jgi:hypothetical protein
MKYFRKYFSSLTLAVIGGYIIRLNIHFGDYCTGVPDGIKLAFLFLIFFTVFSIIVIRDLYISKMRITKFNFWPVYTVFAFFTIFILMSWLKGKLNESRVILTANMKSYPYRLNLLKDRSFSLNERYIEMTCYYFGNYAWEKDTLTLHFNDNQLHKKELSGQYIFNTSKTELSKVESIGDSINPSDSGSIIILKVN